MNVHVTDSMTEDSFDNLQRLVHNLSRWRDPIEKALRYADDTHSFDDVVGAILANRMFFFCSDRSFALVTQEPYPKYTNLHCFLAGGDLEEILSKIPNMKALGAQLGCKHLTMAGRLGWSRVLSERGWNFACTTMSTPIGEE